jgi:tetrahydromethanopterin S-methyltransferase subunit C
MGTAAFKGVETAMLMYKVMRGIKNVGSILKYVKAVANTYKALKAATTVVKGTKTVVNAINLARSINLVAKGVEAAEAGIVAAGAASAPFTFGLGFAVALLISIILDAVMSAIESWIENRNVCVLLPLWWEAKPFIAGVKDGEKILLIKDENNGSDENTEEDGRETDEDEMTVEDN